MAHDAWILGGLVAAASLSGPGNWAIENAIGSAPRDVPQQLAQAAPAAPPYTADQAFRGKMAFEQTCSGCHGSNLRGGANEFQAPPLAGPFFFEKWTGKPVSDLIAYAIDNMPPTGTKLPVATYVDIAAYIIQNWKYSPGSELKRDSSAIIKPAP